MSATNNNQQQPTKPTNPIDTVVSYNVYMQTQDWRQQTRCPVNLNPACTLEEQAMLKKFEEERVKQRDACSAEYNLT
jgi:hypothetical protein